MLRNLIGFDLQPHSGAGVNLILNGSDLVVDQDRNGVPDGSLADYDLRDVNDSPAARGTSLFEWDVLARPAPDVDYTYPDHNNMFLAYKGYTWDKRLNPPALRLVVKPSFHRPELLRNSSGLPNANWAISANTAGRLFRPHPQHYNVWHQNTATTC